MPAFDFRRQTVTVGPGLVPFQLIGGNQLRLSLVFTVQLLNPVGVGTSEESQPFAPQFWVDSRQNVVLTYKDLGPMIQSPWFLTWASGAGFLTIQEVFSIPGSF